MDTGAGRIRTDTVICAGGARSREVGSRVGSARLTRSSGAIERCAPRLLDVGSARGWAGRYEMTPDHNGLIGAPSSVSRFFCATGFSGHGFLMGPVIGEVMRDLFLGVTP